MDNPKTTDPQLPEAESESLAAPPTPIELERSQAELETLRDRHLRLQADFDNFRRRTQRERIEAQARAHEELLRSLLPVLDHFEFGLRSAAEHGAEPAVRAGFQLVQDELIRVLDRAGLAAVDTEPGQPFDPHQHEAVTHVPSSDFPADTIVQQTRRGYKLGPTLLRPAQVVVSSGAPAAAQPEETDGGT